MCRAVRAQKRWERPRDWIHLARSGGGVPGVDEDGVGGGEDGGDNDEMKRSAVGVVRVLREDER